MAHVEEYAEILDFNFTYDYFNLSYIIISDPAGAKSHERDVIQWILLGLYMLTTVIAVPGNIFVIWHYRPKGSWNNKNIFITSLAVSDLGLVFVSVPFKVIGQHLNPSWPFCNLLCPLSTYLHLVLVIHRSMSLLLLTIYRHYVIFRSPKKVSLGFQGKVTYILALLLSFLVALPVAMYSKVQHFDVGFQKTTYLCVEIWDSNKQRLYYSIAIMVLQYIVPLVILCISNFYVGLLVWVRKPLGENLPQKIKGMQLKKRRTVKVLICMAVFYALSWLPFHVITVVGTNNKKIMNQESLQVLWLFSHWFAFTNCAVHPINYFVMNKDFRRTAKTLLQRLCCCSRTPQTQFFTYTRSSLTFRNNTRSFMRESVETKL